MESSAANDVIQPNASVGRTAAAARTAAAVTVFYVWTRLVGTRPDVKEDVGRVWFGV